MKRILLLMLFALSANLALAQFTQTYLISSGQLANMASNCGTTGAFYVNGGGVTGFNYTDVIPASSIINSVTVEVAVGIECTAETKSTTMNGVGQTSITTVNECLCDPTGTNGIKTINVSPASYIKSGTNQFRIISTNHFGLMPSAALSNSYARVTVTYYNTVTYVIPAGQLVNMGSNCGTTGAYYVSGAGITGFNWTDGIAAGNGITGVTMELSIGIECAAGTRTTTLNGNAEPSFTTVSDCVCDPTGTNGIKTLTLNPANYIRGGNNQFRINAASSFGLRPSATLGGNYARVTVAYGPVTNTITITAPNGGETYGKGSTQNITWSSTGSVGNVNIYYSTNSGSTFTLISSNEPNDGSYSWAIPGSFATLSTYRIGIEDASNTSVYDISNADFTITNTFTYVIPAGQLINMGSNCGTTGAFYVSGAGITGFNWTDNTPAGATVTSVVMEVSVGIECSAGTRTTTLNGNAEPSFTTVAECICDPTGTNGIKTLNLTPSNLIVGGTNQFRINAASSFGLRPSATLGGYYARVTVTYCFTTAAPGAITGNTTICSGSSNTYSVSPVSGATSYTWTLPSGWTGTSTTNSITTTASTTAGNISVTANNSCAASTASTQAITVNTPPAQPGAMTGAASPCIGTAVTYTVAAVGGATSYTWTIPSGWSGSSTTNSITVTVGANNGNISVTANGACGASAPRARALTPITTPAVPGSISGSSAVCLGSINTYSITAVAGATTYTWTLPGGWSGTSTTNSISATAGATSGNISVTAGNACGTSAAQVLAVSANTVPAAPGAISGTSTICSGSTNTYSISTVSGATSYTWTLPGGWSGSSTTNSITATAGSGSGTISVTANNGCGSSTAQTLSATVNAAPTTPGTISGTTTVCEGSSNTYTVSAVAGATTYTWTLPGGWSGSSTTNSITATAGANSGNVMVTANNSCGSSSAQSQSITVNPLVAASVNVTTGGGTTICTGETVVFTAAPTNGGSTPTYQWRLNSTNVGTNSPTYTNSSLVNGDVVSCVMTSNASCLTGGSTVFSNNVTISVTSAVAASVSISADNSTICAGGSVTFTAAATGGGTTPSYQWKVNGSNAGTNSATFTSSSLNNGDVVTCVMTTSSSCATGSPATSNAVTISVTSPVTPAVSIAGNNTLCAGTSTTFTATPTNGGSTPTYQWFVNGNNTGVTTDTYSSSSLNNGDVVTCTMTSNAGCTTSSTANSNSITMSVTTPLTVSVSISASNSTICAGTSTTFNASATNGGTSPSYQWQVNGSNVGSNSSSFTTSALLNNDVVTCILTSSETCVSGNNVSSNAVTMTVNAAVTPSVAIVTGGGSTICPGETVVFTATATNEGSAPTYQWKLNGSNVGTNSTSYVNSSLANGDVVTCELTSNASCATTSAATSNSITITVTTSITASVSITADDDSVCAGGSVTFTAVATGGGTSPSYQWQVNGSNAGSNSASFTTSSLNNGDVVTCIMTSTSSCATGSPATSNGVTVTTSTQSTPSISQTTNTLTSSVTGTSYTWYLNGNLLTTTTVPSLNITQSGNYTVEVDNGIGCSATSAPFNATVVGVSDIIVLNNDLSIYPNPSTGLFTINATILKDAEVKIMVLNNLGQEVVNMTSSVVDNKLTQEINISELPSGSYFLVVAGSEGSTTHKLMLSK